MFVGGRLVVPVKVGVVRNLSVMSWEGSWGMGKGIGFIEGIVMALFVLFNK